MPPCLLMPIVQCLSSMSIAVNTVPSTIVNLLHDGSSDNRHCPLSFTSPSPKHYCCSLLVLHKSPGASQACYFAQLAALYVHRSFYRRHDFRVRLSLLLCHSYLEERLLTDSQEYVYLHHCIEYLESFHASYKNMCESFHIFYHNMCSWLFRYWSQKNDC